MSEQPEDVTTDDEVNEDLDFGEAEHTESQPFWKREILFGYSLPWVLGGVLLLAAGAWFVFGTTHGSVSEKPSDADFRSVEDVARQGAPTQDVTAPTTATPSTAPAALPADTLQMMKDVRDELNEREERINASIRVLQNSISQLSDAIKRDEAYAVETRNQLNALSLRQTAIETRQASSPAPSASPHVAARKKSHTVAAMNVVSLDNGMAWIKWKGSTWAVREGDQLGRVTINRIDPTTRTVTTSAGVLH